MPYPDIFVKVQNSLTFNSGTPKQKLTVLNGQMQIKAFEGTICKGASGDSEYYNLQ